MERLKISMDGGVRTIELNRPDKRHAIDSAMMAEFLDAFGADIARLKGGLPTADRVRIDQYLDSIREVERQIQRAESAAQANPEPDIDRPMGVPAAFADHARLNPGRQRLTFDDVERIWDDEIRPKMKDFASMQDGAEPVPEDSQWFANWRVPQRN